ncbi:MAG TPA: TRAP transporter substrate-binding protein DctP [Polyangia bacterium]
MRLASAILLAAVAASAVARAEPATLRLATVAPQGTGWAREIGAWGRDVETGTHDAVRVKIYYSAVGGDELTVLERIKRDQLDGAIGSESCVRLAPSLKVTRIFGLFQSREEALYVLGRLAPAIDGEFLRAGFVNLASATLGPDLLFTREPVHDMAELKKTLLWSWDADETLTAQAQALGMHVVTTPLDDAARAYDDKSVDGFIAMPTAALAFQWSTQARYLQNLPLSYRNGCFFVASRVFDALPIDAQRYLRAAAAKLRGRLDDLSRRQDDELVGGLFARQGLKSVAVSDHFRLELFGEAREMRDRIAPRLLAKGLLEEVLSWLADYRVERPLAK